jgi:hypothetical protein
MSVIIAFVASYFVLLVLLSEMVRPARRRLTVLADELLCMDLSPEAEGVIRSMLHTAYSIRAAPLTLLALTIAVFTPSAKINRQVGAWVKENPEVAGDRRWNELYSLYYASISAVNPIFGLMLFVARWIFRLKAYLFVIQHYRPTRRQMADLKVRPKMDVRPKVAEMEIFTESKATVAA